MRTSSLAGFLAGLGTGGTTGDAGTDEARPAAADVDGGQIACNSCSQAGEVDQVQETGKKSAARCSIKRCTTFGRSGLRIPRPYEQPAGTPRYRRKDSVAPLSTWK